MGSIGAIGVILNHADALKVVIVFLNFARQKLSQQATGVEPIVVTAGERKGLGRLMSVAFLMSVVFLDNVFRISASQIVSIQTREPTCDAL